MILNFILHAVCWLTCVCALVGFIYYCSILLTKVEEIIDKLELIEASIKKLEKDK